MPEFVFELPFPSEPSATADSVLADGTIDHYQGAIDRLPQQFKEEEVYRLLRVLTAPYAILETTLLQVLLGWLLDSAVGQQLADIGELVGQPNLDFPDDDTYRRYIRARIVANRSSGTTNQLIRISDLVIGDDTAIPVIQRYGHASVMVEIDGFATTDGLAAILLSFLRTSVGGAIRVVLTYSTMAPTDVLTLDDGPGLDDGFLLGSIE